MREDLLFQRHELGSGVDADLLDEKAPGVRCRAQRVDLTAGPVQGHHQLGVETLVKWVSDDELLELGHQLGVPADRQHRLVPHLERCQP